MNEVRKNRKGSYKLPIFIVSALIIMIVSSLWFTLEMNKQFRDNLDISLRNQTDSKIILNVEVNGEKSGYLDIPAGNLSYLKGKYHEGDRIYIFNPFNYNQSIEFKLTHNHIHLDIYWNRISKKEF